MIYVFTILDYFVIVFWLLDGTTKNSANLVAVDPNLIILNIAMTGNFNQFNLSDPLLRLNLCIECTQTPIIIAIYPLQIFLLKKSKSWICNLKYWLNYFGPNQIILNVCLPSMIHAN